MQQITFDAEKIIQPIYTGGDIAIDESGRILATCLGDEALLTDVTSGDTLARVEGDGEVLTALRITPSASHLIACSRSLSMRIFSLGRSEDSNRLSVTLLSTLKPHNSPVVSAAVDRSGTLLATGSADGVIKVWDIRGGYVSHTFRGHTGVISSLLFFELSPELAVAQTQSHRTKKSKKGASTPWEQDSKNDAHAPASALRLASGGEDSKVRVWNLVERVAVASLESHVSVVRGLDFCSSRAVFLSSSRDKTLIIWDARTWKARKIIPVLESVEAAGFLCDGRLLYSGGEHGRIRIWATEGGQEVTGSQEIGSEDESITDILCIPQDQSLLCIRADQTLTFYSTKKLRSIASEKLIEPFPASRCISGTHDEIIDLAYAGINRGLMALATNEKYVKLVSVQMRAGESTDSTYFGAEMGQLQGHEDIVICLGTDWSGCWIATGGKDNTARLWRIDQSINSYQCVTAFTGHTESIGAITLPSQIPPNDSAAFQNPIHASPSLLITGSQDKTVKVWTISTENKQIPHSPGARYTRKAHDKDINAIAINFASTLFASASQDRTVKIWSVQDGEIQGILRGHRRGVWSVSFAPKNTPSLIGDSGAISSSRGIVLTGSGDKTVKIWSLTDYSCIRTFEGHTNTVLKVLWLPPLSQDTTNSSATARRPTLVASAGGDGLVKLWDAQEGECACTLDNHTDRVWALDSNPDTGQLVSGGGDGVVTFWTDSTASTAAASAAASTARVEQEQELANYVRRGNYRDAIVLSLQLNHPARLLSLFKDVIEKHPPEPDSLSGLKVVDHVLAELGDEQLFTLLLRLRDWNTNARTARVAQRILWVVAKSYPASRLVRLRKKGRGLEDVLEALRVYTERHYKRFEELIDESYFVDFVVRGMEEVGFVGDRVENDGRMGREDVVMVG